MQSHPSSTRLLPLLLLITLLIPWRAASGGEDAQPAALEIGTATILASPGTPRELRNHLPRSQPFRGPPPTPRVLSWPLPTAGDLLVIGLPLQDPVARHVCDVFGWQCTAETLNGGYVIHAWRDGKRNLVFLFGADALALSAASREFELSAPAGMADPNMRSLDFKKPDTEATSFVRAGHRRVRPSYRTRAMGLWDSKTPLTREAVYDLSSTRANEVWLSEEQAHAQPARLKSLRDQGIQVVHTLRWSAEPGTAVSVATWAAALDKSRRHTHVAIVFDTPLRVVKQLGTYYAAYERSVVRKVAAHLRPDLQQLYVVPRCHSDRLSDVYGAPPDLSEVPEASICWSGPLEHSTRITRKAAERRVQEAGVPVLLLDRWAEPFSSPRHAPTLPSGRDAHLGEILDGVVVIPGVGAQELLRAAWDPRDVPTTAAAQIGAFAAQGLGGQDAAPLLESAIAGVLELDREAQGFYPWMQSLARELRSLRAPVTGVISASTSGHRDPWKRAGVLAAAQGLTLLAHSDGSALHVRLEVGARPDPTLPYLMQLRLDAPGRAAGWRVVCTPEGSTLERVADDPHALSRVGQVDVRRSPPAKDGSFRIDIHFDRFALGGEAHVLRHFRLGVSWGPRNLWPAATQNGRLGTILIVD